jgi:hypothetical protein
MVVFLLLAACGPPSTEVPLGAAARALELPIDAAAEEEPTAAPSGAADWTVDCNGGADAESISDAISMAEDGDWIEVEPCTYRERLDYGGKSLWISSTGGAADTILDAQSGGYNVTVAHGETDGTGLVNFTLRGGADAAVYAYFAAIHLEGLTITDTSGNYVVVSDSADVEVDDTVIVDNQAAYAPVVASRGAIVMTGSQVECGRGGYGAVLSHGSAFFDWSTFDCPSGYSMYWTHAVGRIQRSTLDGALLILNEDDHYDDLVYLENVVHNGSQSVTYGTYLLRNSIVRGPVSLNTVSETAVIENSVFQQSGNTCAINSTAPLTVRNNDFDGITPDCTGVNSWVGADGNIAEDPLFVDEARGDYHLGRGSPLQDAGYDGGVNFDVDGSANDIGVFGGRKTMDGGW